MECAGVFFLLNHVTKPLEIIHQKQLQNMSSSSLAPLKLHVLVSGALGDVRQPVSPMTNTALRLTPG